MGPVFHNYPPPPKKKGTNKKQQLGLLDTSDFPLKQ